MAERNLDFDKVIDRRNTGCLKYDFAKKRGMPEDVLPLWVADMDFRTTSYLGEDNRYHIDFYDFERKIKEERLKLFFLCSPHNPVGRVWTPEELEKLGDICVKHGVIVVSDEIHQDFSFGRKHTVFAGLKKEYEDICITCTSPSKTFNLAGLALSNIFIPNRKLRQKFRKELSAAGISQPGVMGLAACEAAYRNGEEWYRAMLSYIKGNIAYIKRFIKENLPGVNMTDHEGAYLVWLDFRGTGLETEELDELLIHKAKLWLDSGKIFGACGNGFQRINAACPRSVLKEALERIKACLPQGGQKE